MFGFLGYQICKFCFFLFYTHFCWKACNPCLHVIPIWAHCVIKQIQLLPQPVVYISMIKKLHNHCCSCSKMLCIMRIGISEFSLFNLKGYLLDFPTMIWDSLLKVFRLNYAFAECVIHCSFPQPQTSVFCQALQLKIFSQI